MNTPVNPLINPPLDSKYQKSEPFLWFHVALLAAVPLTLILGMLGLGVGDPVLSEWFEITVLGLPAIALPIILQWWRPLSPFSLWLFAKPLELTDDNERRILAVVKDFKTVLVAIALGVLIDAVFCKMYSAAPIVANALPIPDGLRILGIIWWLGFFLISNFLIQVGAVAIRVLLLSEADLNRLTPLPLENINAVFTSLGKRSPNLLNFIPDSIPETISEAILEDISLPKVKVEDQAPKSEEPTEDQITSEAPEPEIVEAEIPLIAEEPVPETPTSIAEIIPELPIVPAPIVREAAVGIPKEIAPVSELVSEPVKENLEIPSQDPQPPVTNLEELNESVPEQVVVATEDITIKTEVVETQISIEIPTQSPLAEPPANSLEAPPITKTETISPIESAWGSPITPTPESL